MRDEICCGFEDGSGHGGRGTGKEMIHKRSPIFVGKMIGIHHSQSDRRISMNERPTQQITESCQRLKKKSSNLLQSGRVEKKKKKKKNDLEKF
jgi:hypothetical protein